MLLLLLSSSSSLSSQCVTLAGQKTSTRLRLSSTGMTDKHHHPHHTQPHVCPHVHVRIVSFIPEVVFLFEAYLLSHQSKNGKDKVSS